MRPVLEVQAVPRVETGVFTLLKGMPMSVAAGSPDDQPAEIMVIPVTDVLPPGGRFEHRLPPTSQAQKAQNHLAPLVQLSTQMLERLTHMAVNPDQLAVTQPEPHRVANGWLYLVRFRAYVPLLSPAMENDRLLADAAYAADPRAGDKTRALAQPAPHESYAALVHGDTFEDLAESVDRAAAKIRKENPQEVGERLVELPLTVVSAMINGPDGVQTDEATGVDGNSRLISCLGQLKVERGWLTGGTDRERVELQPSHLMRIPLKARRELVRKIIKAEYKLLGAAGLEQRNAAARALNALTVPVQVIVGYRDDEPERGMSRFPGAVRALLVRMNVGVKPFGDGAKHAVVAEEVVSALYDAGLFGSYDGWDPKDVRDMLIGRDDMEQVMESLGFDFNIPDQRFVLVVEQLTRKERGFNAVVRDKLQSKAVYLKDRNSFVTELGLRSYSSSLEGDLPTIRRALETGCLWQDLVDREWQADPRNNDATIDHLLAAADREEPSSLMELGVLGMISLVTSGHLLAARGSAEQLVDGQMIARTGVGLIVRALLDMAEGRQLLADAVKRVRKGLAPRWWDAERQELVDRPQDWRGATFDAHLRLAARNGFSDRKEVQNPAALEAHLLTKFTHSIKEVDQRLAELLEEREKNGTTGRLGWEEVEASMELLDGIKEDFQGISTPRPRRRS